jgi:hypothetical protein
VLRKKFGPKREEVVGGWRGLYNEELHNLYVSPNVVMVIKSMNIRWAGCVARSGEINAYNILFVRPEGKTSFRRSWRRWEHYIRMDLREIRCKDVDWMHLTQIKGPVAGPCEHDNESSGSVKGRELFD